MLTLFISLIFFLKHLKNILSKISAEMNHNIIIAVNYILFWIRKISEDQCECE